MDGRIQGDSNEEVYTLKTSNRKLKAKYGDSLRFTFCEGRPSIMLHHEEVDQIVLESSMETVSNSRYVEEDLKDFVFVGREIAQCLQESSEHEEFYPYPSDLTLENFSALIPKNLSYFLDAYIYEVKDIYFPRKEKLAKGHHCSRDHAMVQKRRIPVTTSTCYQFVHSSNHKITCSG